MTEEVAGQLVNVSVPALVRLAQEVWRLRASTGASDPEQIPGLEARLTRMERALATMGVRVWDPVGHVIDGALAVLAVDSLGLEVSVAGASPVIVERTLLPIVYIGERVAAWGEVVAGPAGADRDRKPGGAT